MFLFTYNFFDYKYNIEGYNGAHYGSTYQYVYLISCIVLSLILAFVFRKVKKDQIKKILKIFSIFICCLYLTKTIWESYWDIKTGRGFNTYLLPFDTCSILMWASLCAGFGKGKIEKAGVCWLMTLGFTGGMANALFLQALKYYPFWTFGAFYSMAWHFFMILIAFWLLFSNYVELNFKVILYAMAMHLVFSIPVFFINGFKHMDFMLYETAGGIPLIEGLVKPLADKHQYGIVTIIMVFVYLGITSVLTGIYIGVKAIISLFKPKKKVTE